MTIQISMYRTKQYDKAQAQARKILFQKYHLFQNDTIPGTVSNYFITNSIRPEAAPSPPSSSKFPSNPLSDYHEN